MKYSISVASRQADEIARLLETSIDDEEVNEDFYEKKFTNGMSFKKNISYGSESKNYYQIIDNLSFSYEQDVFLSDRDFGRLKIKLKKMIVDEMI